MTNRTMMLHGDRVAYRDEGAGEVLLLIHGMGGSSASWRSVVPALSKKYRVIAPDLLGHGQSDKPRGDYSLGAFAVWLRDFLDALGVEKATVIGHSLGGGVALQFAHQHRTYCRRLVLISSGGLGSEVGRLLKLLSLPGAELVLPLIASRPAITAGNALRAWRQTDREVTRFSETWRAHAALSNRDNRQAFLRTLRSVVDHRGQAVCALNRLHFNADLPAMIISGDQDRVIPVAHAHAAHEALPNSRLHILPGVWHHPQIERPTAVTELIDEFIGATGVEEFTDATGIDEFIGAAPARAQRVVHAVRAGHGVVRRLPSRAAIRRRRWGGHVAAVPREFDVERCG
ncbi:MAG: alpha/beta fold hydrolase [Mycobacteriaceae bacterium]|nr:alpha/beta fold hydrolase [Mycobacteriaceae bacterium]